MTATPGEKIPALTPRDSNGHQFVVYADSCSGVPGALHEHTLAAVNAVIQRLEPQPEFICFPGDEISGLTSDEATLRRQWDYWLNHEMVWLDRESITLYHATGNHTTYDPMSEAVFRDVLAHLPGNGPPGQEGLSYFVRRDDLLLVFVHTLWSGLGGEGRVETAWLDEVLRDQADARHKLVLGHHPVHPVNGFSGAFQREIEPENGRRFWDVLVRHGVLAYVCSHILAFDVQVHEGVLQILTAGAGTAHRMPEEIEYLHCVQAALDDAGLRYQVLDTEGRVREWLTWPLRLPPSSTWDGFDGDDLTEDEPQRLIVWQFSGTSADSSDGSPQTLLSGWGGDSALSPVWVGLTGAEQRLAIFLSPAPGRSPHQWYGPALGRGQAFSIQVAIHSGMGPGGLLWRWGDGDPWSSLRGASPWGAERLTWPGQWGVGFDRHEGARPFRGRGLQVKQHRQGIAPPG